MKALKALLIMLVAVFSFTAVNAQNHPVPRRHHHHPRHHKHPIPPRR